MEQPTLLHNHAVSAASHTRSVRSSGPASTRADSGLMENGHSDTHSQISSSLSSARPLRGADISLASAQGRLASITSKIAGRVSPAVLSPRLREDVYSSHTSVSHTPSVTVGPATMIVVESLQDEVHRLRRAARKHTQELEDTETRLYLELKKNKSLNMAMIDISATHDRCGSRIASLQQELANVQAQLASQAATTSRGIDISDAARIESDAATAVLRRQLGELQATVSAREQKIAELEARIASADAKLREALREEKERSQVLSERAAAATEAADKAHRDAEDTERRLQQEITRLKRELLALESTSKELETLRGELQALQSAGREREKTWQASVDKIRSESEAAERTLREEIARAKLDLSAATRELELLRTDRAAETEQWKRKLSEMQSSIETATQSLRDKEKSWQASIEKMRSESEARERALRDENTKLKLDLDDKERARAMSVRDRDMLATEMAALKDRERAAREAADKAEERGRVLDRQLVTVTRDAEQVRTDTTAEITNLKRRLADSEAALVTARNQFKSESTSALTDLNLVLAQKEKLMSEQKQAFAASEASHKALVADLQARLADMQKQMASREVSERSAIDAAVRDRDAALAREQALTRQVDEMQRASADLKLKIQSLEKQLAEAVANAKDLQSQRKMDAMKRAVLNISTQSSTTRAEETEHKLSVKEQELKDKMRDARDQQYAGEQALREELNGARAEAARVQAQMLQLAADHDAALQRLHGEHTTHITTIETRMRQETAAMRAENVALKEDNAQLHARVAELNQQLIDCQRQLRDLKAEMTQMMSDNEATLANLQGELEAAHEEEVRDMEAELEMLRMSQTSLTTTETRMTAKVSALEAQCEDYEKKIQYLRANFDRERQDLVAKMGSSTTEQFEMLKAQQSGELERMRRLLAEAEEQITTLRQQALQQNARMITQVTTMQNSASTSSATETSSGSA